MDLDEMLGAWLEPRQLGCGTGQVACGTGCIPTGWTCCPDGLGGCRPGDRCQPGDNGIYGCCPNSAVCTGNGAGLTDASRTSPPTSSSPQQTTPPTSTYPTETTSSSTSGVNSPDQAADDPATDSPPVGAIVGGVIGGLALLGLVAFLFFLLGRRRSRSKADEKQAAAVAPDAGTGGAGTYAAYNGSKPSPGPQEVQGSPIPSELAGSSTTGRWSSTFQSPYQWAGPAGQPLPASPPATWSAEYPQNGQQFGPGGGPWSHQQPATSDPPGGYVYNTNSAGYMPGHAPATEMDASTPGGMRR